MDRANHEEVHVIEPVKKTQSAKFVALESCRGICALLVALVHLSANGHFYNLALVRNGGLGVTYFFVLSGFVMMHAYGSRLRSGNDLGPFVIRRFGRLYPLHILILAVLVLLELVKLAMTSRGGVSSGVPAFSGANSLSALAGGVALVNGLGFFKDFTWNGPSWTISTEFWTYLVFFGVLMLGRRAPQMAFALVAVSGLALAINEARGDPLSTITGEGAILCIYCFFIGMLTYIVARPPLARRGSSSIWEWLALLLTAAAFLGVVPWRSVFNPLIFAFVVLILSFQSGAVSKLLGHRSLVYLGTISYSMYMVHFTILALLDGAVRVLASKGHFKIIRFGVGESGYLIDTGHQWQMDLLALVYLMVVVAVASVTYRIIEVPFRDRFNRIAERMTPARREQTATRGS
jgi:peptidoglycan/LPS O-acetylase OafA/YrhL